MEKQVTLVKISPFEVMAKRFRTMKIGQTIAISLNDRTEADVRQCASSLNTRTSSRWECSSVQLDGHTTVTRVS